MVLKIRLKTALEFVELHRSINHETIYFKNWRRACIHSPTWTVFSSDHLWALLSTSRTGQTVSTTEGGWGLFPGAHWSHVDKRQEEVGWTALSCSEQLCSFLSTYNTWESSHSLYMFEEPKEAIFHHASSRKGDLQAWGSSGGGKLGPKGTELLEKGRCGP